jgi:SAM-dependent methyltransferase
MTAGLQPLPANDDRVGIQTLMDAASNYNRWIADQARAHVGCRVLDAGCGAGNLMAMLLDRELVVGVDVWDEFVGIVGRRFAHHTNVWVHRFDLCDPAMVEALRTHRLDSAMLSNVLEHIEDDGAALRNITSVLPPVSPIFLLVPAFMGIYGAHDKEDHHFRRYTKRSLATTLSSLPVTIERQYYMNLPGFFAWYLLGRVIGKPLGRTEVGLYDKLVPLIRAVEARVRPPFGQSLVALLRTTA